MLGFCSAAFSRARKWYGANGGAWRNKINGSPISEQIMCIYCSNYKIYPTADQYPSSVNWSSLYQTSKKSYKTWRNVRFAFSHWQASVCLIEIPPYPSSVLEHPITENTRPPHLVGEMVLRIVLWFNQSSINIQTCKTLYST